MTKDVAKLWQGIGCVVGFIVVFIPFMVLYEKAVDMLLAAIGELYVWIFKRNSR